MAEEKRLDAAQQGEAASANGDDGGSGKLRRAVTPGMLIVFIVGDMVGGGIYALVGEVGAEVGGAIWTAFLAALVLALFTAGAYAELVTKYPRAGGAAIYMQRAFGVPFLTFLVGFMVMMSSITSASALSNAFGGDYLGQFVDIGIKPVAIAVILIVALINLRGISESAKANIAFTLIELAGLALVVVIGLAAILGGEGEPARAFEFKAGDTSVPLLILAGAALSFYALIGFEDSVNIAEETKDPRRAYPRGLFGGLLIGGIVYLIVTIIASMAVATGTLAQSSGPLLEVVKLGPLAVPTKLFAVIALFALANTILINMITASRLLYGMGDEGILPGAFARILPGRRTPVVGIAFSSLVAVALILTGGLNALASATVVLLLFAFIGVNIAVLVARRHPVEHDHFRVPTVVPILGVLVCIGLLTQQTGEVFVRVGILLAIGLVLFGLNYVIGRALARRGGEAPAT
jgi:amino acid transporter